MNTTQSRKKTLFLTEFSILLAIEALFCFTPLGSLPAIGPIVATLMMIPVVLTGLLLGTGAGTAMGAFAGLFSFIVWTFTPPSPAVAFLFTPFYSFGEISGNIGSLIICFLPRTLAGTVAGLSYRAFGKVFRGKVLPAMALTGALGSLTNTIGVVLGIWLFFGGAYSSLVGQSMVILAGTTVLTSGIPEAVINAIVCPAIGRAVSAVRKGRES